MEVLEHISWKDYFIGVTLAIAVYYIIIGVRFYAVELRDIMAGRRKIPTPLGKMPNDSQPGADEADDPDAGAPSGDASHGDINDDMEEVDRLVGKLKAIIADAAEKKAGPQELKIYLKRLFHAHPGIAGSPLRGSINELTVAEVERYGETAITEREVDALWLVEQ